MPIKPENAQRYPADWQAIRQEVLARAQDRCEACGVANHAWIWRDETGQHHFVDKSDCEYDGRHWYIDLGHYEGCPKVIQVVLTIAHKDHVPENVGEPGNRPNLAAWCQRCHLAWDRGHHQHTAHQTRRDKKQTLELF